LVPIPPAALAHLVVLEDLLLLVVLEDLLLLVVLEDLLHY
jgi:hypothetical protein